MCQHNSFPKASDISLAMCRDFATKVLLATRFHYFFSDGSNLVVEFRSWAIFHLLSMQHIGVRDLHKENFLDKIQSGFDFEEIKKNKSTRKKYAGEKDRIVAFVYLYRALRNCEVVYFETRKISEASKVRFDYIFFHELDGQGINVGTRLADGVQVPLSILISKKSNVGRYIENGEKKDVQQIEISDIATKEMIEVVKIPKEKETVADKTD